MAQDNDGLSLGRFPTFGKRRARTPTMRCSLTQFMSFSDKIVHCDDYLRVLRHHWHHTMNWFVYFWRKDQDASGFCTVFAACRGVGCWGGSGEGVIPSKNHAKRLRQTPSISTYHTFRNRQLLPSQRSSPNVCLIEDAILASNESFDFVSPTGYVSVLRW